MKLIRGTSKCEARRNCNLVFFCDKDIPKKCLGPNPCLLCMFQLLLFIEFGCLSRQICPYSKVIGMLTVCKFSTFLSRLFVSFFFSGITSKVEQRQNWSGSYHLYHFSATCWLIYLIAYRILIHFSDKIHFLHSKTELNQVYFNNPLSSRFYYFRKSLNQ